MSLLLFIAISTSQASKMLNIGFQSYYLSSQKHTYRKMNYCSPKILLQTKSQWNWPFIKLYENVCGRPIHHMMADFTSVNKHDLSALYFTPNLFKCQIIQFCSYYDGSSQSVWSLVDVEIISVSKELKTLKSLAVFHFLNSTGFWNFCTREG